MIWAPVVTLLLLGLCFVSCGIHEARARSAGGRTYPLKDAAFQLLLGSWVLFCAYAIWARLT